VERLKHVQKRNQLLFCFNQGNNGENLWGGSGELATDFDPIRAVRAWFNEYEYYEFYNHTCIPGKKCGHYTQV